MAQLREFSIEEKLGSLIHLQKIDSKMDEIKILKGELPMEVADLEDELQGLRARQTRIEEEINGVTEFIEERKTAIKESEALIKKYEKDSENVKNNREFEAINKETEMQQLEIKLAEKHIKDANEEIAEKVILLEKAKKNIATKEGSLELKKSELEKIISANEKEEKEFLNSIPDVIKRNLFPKLSDSEIEKELIKLHKIHASNRQNTNSSIGIKRKTNRNNK